MRLCKRRAEPMRVTPVRQLMSRAFEETHIIIPGIDWSLGFLQATIGKPRLKLAKKSDSQIQDKHAAPIKSSVDPKI